MAYRAVKCQIPDIAFKLGLELQQVADLADISPTQLSDYISMRRLPGWENAMSIAMALKCKIEDLYESEYYQKKETGTKKEQT